MPPTGGASIATAVCTDPSMLTVSGPVLVMAYVVSLHSGSGVFVEISNRSETGSIGPLRFPSGHSLMSSGQGSHDP